MVRPPPLTKRDMRNLAGLLQAASDMMTSAWNAHACGLADSNMLEVVSGVREDMGRFLAFFEDGSGYGLTDPSNISTMRNIEMMATHLIEDLEQEAAA